MSFVGIVLYLLALMEGFPGRGAFAREVTIKLWPCQTHAWISENETQNNSQKPNNHNFPWAWV